MRMPAVSPFASRVPTGRARPSPASRRADDLSGMFWNPAVMTQFAGIQSALSTSANFPLRIEQPDRGHLCRSIWRHQQYRRCGIGPCRLFLIPDQPELGSACRSIRRSASRLVSPSFGPAAIMRRVLQNLATYNATPSVAYRINDWISVGAGVQIQYARMAFDHGLTGFNPNVGLIPVGDANLSANGWGYGFTAGVTLTPTPTTTIGLGYRSESTKNSRGLWHCRRRR